MSQWDVQSARTQFSYCVSLIVDNQIFLTTLLNCGCLGLKSFSLLCNGAGGLASRVKRKDTLALRLERQEREEREREREADENHDGSSWTNREQWEELRNRIGTTLTR